MELRFDRMLWLPWICPRDFLCEKFPDPPKDLGGGRAAGAASAAEAVVF